MRVSLFICILQEALNLTVTMSGFHIYSPGTVKFGFAEVVMFEEDPLRRRHVEEGSILAWQEGFAAFGNTPRHKVSKA